MTKERVAVITGASRGIGAGLARHFHEQGVRLGLCARSESALPASDTVLTRQFDIRDEPSVEAFVTAVAERFGHIDVWINNAGVLAPIAPLRDIALADYQQHIDVNVMGVFLGSRAYARHVRASDSGGVLINISSAAATVPYAGWSAYCAGKAAVDLMSGVLQIEERDAGLRVHAVSPGIIDTDMQELIRGTSADDFPDVAAFHGFKERDAFSTPGFVAEKMFQLAFSEPEDEVVVRFPAQYPDRF